MSKSNPENMIDLDAFLEQLYGEGRHIKLYGKTWKLVSDLPAGIRLALRGDSDLSADQEVKLFKELFDPQEQYEELMAMGLGSTAWDAILRIVLGSYGNLTPEQVLTNFKNEKLGKLIEPETKTETETSE